MVLSKTKILFSLLGLSVLGSVPFMYSNYTGYCFSSGVHANKSVIFDKYINMILEHGDYSGEIYVDKSDYMRKNPNCCRVEMASSIFGFVVVLESTFHHVDSDGKSERRYIAYEFDKCGVIISRPLTGG